MKTRTNTLSHPLFLTTLALLLLNDFMLKPVFPGAVTGKLSDVAGVFAFTVFGLALFPRQRIPVALGSVVWFIYWKSPFSQPLIDGFNGLNLYPIRRTVDYTDLWALYTVPLALWFVQGKNTAVSALPAVQRIAIPALCLFAFCATSRIERYGYLSHGMPVDSGKRWNTTYTQPELDTLFTKLTPNIYTDTATGDQILSDVFVGEELIMDVWLHVTDTGKKRSVQIKGYYVCYTPSLVRVNERVLNRVFYEKLNAYTDSKKPL